MVLLIPPKSDHTSYVGLHNHTLNNNIKGHLRTSQGTALMSLSLYYTT
jgi:hypothetical protein